MSASYTTKLNKGWRIARVGEILKVRNGYAFKSTDYKTDGVPLIRQSNLRDEVVNIAEAKRVDAHFLNELPGFVIRDGDLLIGMSGSLGKISRYQQEEPALQNQRTGLLLVNPEQEPKFAKLVLKFVEPQILAEGKGIAVQNVSAKEIEDCTFPLPPLPEQRRIVAEIEKQFTRLDAGVAALRRVQANLKRYRAAVLKAACEGKLVPTEADWKYIPLRELIGKISQGWSPKCDLTREPLPHEWAIVTTTAIQPMQYIDNQGKPLPATFKPRPHIEIKEGDFLMTRKGPRKRAGVACLVRSTRPRMMVCDTVYRFRCHEARVDPSYLELALNSPSVVEAIDRQKAGINESGVSLTHDKLGGVMIPLPPLAEQTRIVAEVERRLSVAEELESVVTANLQRASSLRQSILQKAFTGELCSPM